MPSPPALETPLQQLRRERREKKYARYQQAIASQSCPEHIQQRPFFTSVCQLHHNAPPPKTASHMVMEANKLAKDPHYSLDKQENRTEKEYGYCHYKDIYPRLPSSFDYSVLALDPSECIAIDRHMLSRRRYHVYSVSNTMIPLVPVFFSTQLLHAVMNSTPIRSDACESNVPFFQSKSAVLWVVALALFTDMVVYGVIIPTLPSLIKERLPDLTPTDIGFLFASYSIGLLLITPIVGILSDRYKNRKVPMVLGMFGLAFCTISFAYGQTLWQLVLARMCQGLAGGVSWTIGLSMMADVYPAQQLGSVMGQVLSANTLGFFVGPPIGGVLFQHVSPQAPFYFCAALALIDLLFRLNLQPTLTSKTLVQEPTETDPLLHASIDTLSDSASQHSHSTLTLDTTTTSTPSTNFIQLARDPQCICTCIAIIVVASVFSGIEPTLPVYLLNRFQLDPSAIGLVFIAIILPNMASSLMVGPLSDRVGRKNVTAMGLLLMALSTPLIHLSHDILTLICAMGFFGISAGIALTPTLPEMADIVEEKGGGAYGSVYALYNVAYSGGMMLGPIIGGALTQAYGFHIQMWAFALVCLLTSPLVWIAHLYK